MSSRGDYRRDERERGRGDRSRDRYSRSGGYRDEPRRRTSRSRSPRHGGDRDRDRRGGTFAFSCFKFYWTTARSIDRRDYRRDDDRHRERDRDRERERERAKKDGGRKRDEREYPRGERKVQGPRTSDHPSEPKDHSAPATSQLPPRMSAHHLSLFFLSRLVETGKSQSSGSKLEHKKPLDDEQEEGEEMDVINEDEDAMMAMMGMSGFGSTKVSSRATSWLDCLLVVLQGPARHWKSRGGRECQENTNLASVYEQVSHSITLSHPSLPIHLSGIDVVDSIDHLTRSNRLQLSVICL